MITVRNPVHAALLLVLCFFTSAAIWLLIEAEFLAVVLILVYVGAVMVLFLFVVMMLDIKVEEVRARVTRYALLGAIVAGVVVFEIVSVVWTRSGADLPRCAPGAAAKPQKPRRTRQAAVPRIRLSIRPRGGAAAGRHRGRDFAHHAQAPRSQASGCGEAGGRAPAGPRAHREDAR